MSRIDVVVTCYNYGRFLRECVDSVLAQSHRDLHLLIIDDASTDETATVCMELAAQDPRVAIHRHPVNIGHISTYNEAIQLAQGDYFLLLSADDFLLPGAIERAVAVLGTWPDVGLVHGAWLPYRVGDTLDCRTDNGGAARVDPVAFIDALAVQNSVATATAIVRASAQRMLGGYLAELPHAGDLEMWLRFALYSQVAYVNALQAVYRRHADNMSLRYHARADFEQRKIAFLMHLGEIRRRLPNGAALEGRIRRRLMRQAVRFSTRALRKGRIVELAALLRFLLTSGSTLLLLALQLRLGLHRQRQISR